MTSNPRELYRKKTQAMFDVLMQKNKLEARTSSHEKHTQQRMGKLICALGLQNEDPLILLGMLSITHSQIQNMSESEKIGIQEKGKALWDALKAQNQNHLKEGDIYG